MIGKAALYCGPMISIIPSTGLKPDIKRFPLPTMWAAGRVYFTITSRKSGVLYMYDENHRWLGMMFKDTLYFGSFEYQIT